MVTAIDPRVAELPHPSPERALLEALRAGVVRSRRRLGGLLPLRSPRGRLFAPSIAAVPAPHLLPVRIWISLPFHPTRPWLAVSTGDGFVQVHDLEAERVVRELVVWPDGEWLVHEPGSPGFVASTDARTRACVLDRGGDGPEAFVLSSWSELEVESLSESRPVSTDGPPGSAAPCFAGDTWETHAAPFPWLPWIASVLVAAGLVGAGAWWLRRRRE